jgi:hypothetical protein
MYHQQESTQIKRKYGGQIKLGCGIYASSFRFFPVG